MSGRYNSFEELYETMLRGNEIEFVYRNKSYFLMPHFNETDEVEGVLLGAAGSNGILFATKEDLYNANIEGEFFGNIFCQTDIVWNNF